MHVLVNTYEKGPIKNSRENAETPPPPPPSKTLCELYATIETRVLIRSDHKTYCSLSPTPMMVQIKFDSDWPAGPSDISV